ncbi:hypothetical protein [Sphingobacterium sp. DR205]|uniref:hypothetical protein n=1 Tax=Sphingobacterium sp. DR205 TaxID=2713573 RepID=UPI0013E4D159|nr:hypothetical protein [Sphingobacterium sp. DR205]QIH33815.1 hypothetical protein G6053_13390 [Sphingobacterium sp. DR205]
MKKPIILFSGESLCCSTSITIRKLTILLFTTVFFLQCCGSGTVKKATETPSQITKAAEKSSTDIDTSVENKDKLKIKYSEHKNLLDILTKLPTHTMESWKWSESERIKFVKFIQKNDFALSSSPYFSKFSLIGANTIGIQVVDGYWTLAIYKIKTNNYIAITDDIVGDGNDLHAFEYKDGQLSEINFVNLFDNNFFSNLLINDKDECEGLLEDSLIGFEYDFSQTTNIVISNSSYLKEREHQNCLKGNTMNYKFNSGTKKFDLTATYWKKSRE